MLGRLPALAAVAMMLACGGDPAPLEAKSPKSERKSDEARAERKRKRAEERKRKEQEEADAAEREERKERMRKREQEREEDAQEQRVAEKEEPAAEESDASDEEAEKETKAEAAREAKKAKAEAKKAKAAEAKAKKEAEAEAKKQKLAEAKAKKSKKKKKNVEEVEEADEEVADEEPKAKKSKKKDVEEADEEVAVEEDKPNPFKKKTRDEEEPTKKVADEPKKKVVEEEPAEEEEPAPKPKAKPKQVAKADKRKSKSKPEPKAEENVDEAEIEVDTASLPPPDPSEESKELDLTAGTPTREEEPEAVAPPTLAIDRRPLTLGRGKIDVHGGLVATAVTASNGMGGTTTASAQGLALGATYGIGAKGELGFDYTLSLHPGDLQGPLMFHGAYVAKQTDKLDIALSLGLAIDFVQSIDPGTMVATTRTAKGLQVGVWARYHLGAKLSAFSGLPALPSSAGSLGKTAPLPPIPYQLSIGLSSVDAIALDLPAGLGYQATQKLYTFGVLDLAHLGMSNTTSALVFSDFIPISLGGFYAASKMDVGAVFSDDLKQGTDYLRFDVVVRYSIK